MLKTKIIPVPEECSEETLHLERTFYQMKAYQNLIAAMSNNKDVVNSEGYAEIWKKYINFDREYDLEVRKFSKEIIEGKMGIASYTKWEIDFLSSEIHLTYFEEE